MADRRKRQRRYILLLVGVAIGVTIAIGLSMRSIFAQISLLQAEKTALEAELAAEQDNTRKAQEHLAYVQTDNYVEKAARERLGWIREGEKRIVAEVEDEP